MYEMQARNNKLLSERRAVSALPGKRRTEGFTQSGPADTRARIASAPGRRTLPLSCNSTVLNDWLSRTSSAVSIRSMRTSSRCYSTSDSAEACDERKHCHSSYSSYSRPTRASMLRQKTCPVRSEQPNYQEVIKKRKAFTLRCKSLSASNIRCRTLPDGESLHAFITGARYNRAHHMDSRSLERVGVYISRRDATRSFVNPSSGIQSPSQEISGSTTQLDVTNGENEPHPSITTRDLDQQLEIVKTTSTTSQELEIAERQQSSGRSSNNEIPNSCKVDSTHDKRHVSSNHANELAAKTDTNSAMKPLNKCRTTSREVLTPTSPMSKEPVSDVAQNLKECTSSWNEIVPGSFAVVSANSLQEAALRVDRKHANIEDLSSPQHSRAEMLSTATEGVPPGIIAQLQEEEGLEEATVVVNDDENEDELISPEARALITDEILRECQRSSSSFASSSMSQDQEVETMQDNDIIDKDSTLSQLEKEPDSTSIHTSSHNNTNGELQAQKITHKAENEIVPCGEDLQESGSQAGSSDRELSAKSSCIFVDMSSLNLDQVQEEEAID